ncbi:MAG: hypothetical protein ACYC0D_07640, partial [Candidatus Humimicrobiaceae bacterium]
MVNTKEDAILLSVKELLDILIKCKKIFISIFIVLFVLILLFNLFLVRNYKVTSEIKINEGFIYFNDILYEYFPDDASNLWMEPEKDFDYAQITRLLTFKREILSLPFLSEVSKQLDSKYDKYDLRKTIDITIDDYKKVLTLSIFAKNPEDAFLICNGITEAYKNFKRDDLNKRYNALLNKIDLKIKDLDKELKVLDSEAQKTAIEFKLDFEKEYGKNNSINQNTNSSSFLTPSNEKKIDDLFYKYNSLKISKENLSENKNYYVDKVNIIKKPEQLDKKDYSVYIRNISMSLVVSFVSALILTFIINYL